MTNILLEGTAHIPSYDLAVIDFERYAKILPIRVRAKLTREIIPSDVSWCDVLVSVRASNPLSRFLVDEVKKVGRKVVLLLDDDLANIRMPDHPYSEKMFRTNLEYVIGKADYLFTPSSYLGEKYHKIYGIKNARFDVIIENQDIKKETHNTSSKVRLLYAASKRHHIFFDKLISPILNKLYDRYGENISLTVIGPDVDTGKEDYRIKKISSMPMAKYREHMLNNDYDIALAPLFDEEFMRSKYYNKYIEYTRYGICGIYSNVIPYSTIIKDTYNGLLVENDCEEWYNKICYAIDNKQLRRNCVKNAREQVLSSFNAQAISLRVADAMPDVFSFKADSFRGQVCKHMFLRYIYYTAKRKIISKLLSVKRKLSI